MASRNYKNKWIENFQSKVEEKVSAFWSQKDQQEVQKAIDKIVEKHKEKDVGVREMRKILDEHDVPESVYSIAANAAILTSAIEIGFENRNQLSSAQKKKIKPVMRIVERSPGETANKVFEISKAEEEKKDIPKWMEDSMLYLAAGSAKKQKESFTKDMKKNKTQNRRTIAKQLRSDVKNRRRQLKSAVQEQVAEGLERKWRRPNTIVVEGQRKKGMLSESYSRRYVESSVHNETESVKATEASVRGIKYKQWITQRDEKVRATHRLMDSITVPINENFVVDGHKASYPGDPRLPIGEKINCRCKLTYKNTLF